VVAEFLRALAPINQHYFYGDAAVLHSGGEIKTNLLSSSAMDEGRKRVIGIMAAIMASLHMRTADDLFGGPEGSPKTDKI
jgi:hypothetical protein